MDIGTFRNDLLELGFSEWHDEEFYRYVFTNENAVVEIPHLRITVNVKLEVRIDYYSFTMIWWHDNGKKVAKIYLIEKSLCGYLDTPGVISDFLCSVAMKFVIDIFKFKV